MQKLFERGIMVEDDTLLVQIEKLRKQMHDIASDKDLTDPVVLCISKKLDSLINEYNLAKDDYNS